jgi:hypothetical protein
MRQLGISRLDRTAVLTEQLDTLSEADASAETAFEA